MRKANKKQKEKIKGEINVLGYNLIKFNVVSVNLILKMCLNLENITWRT